MNLKKLERNLQVNLLEPGPLIKKEFTGLRYHKGGETLVYLTTFSVASEAI